MATEIPTPEEIERVMMYFTSAASDAQQSLLAAKRSGADLAQTTADALVANNNVVGVAINRKSWDDETIEWSKRGDIENIRLDFEDGTQVTVSVLESGDAIDLSIVPPQSPPT